MRVVTHNNRHISPQTVLTLCAALGAAMFWGLAFWVGYA